MNNNKFDDMIEIIRATLGDYWNLPEDEQKALRAQAYRKHGAIARHMLKDGVNDKGETLVDVVSEYTDHNRSPKFFVYRPDPQDGSITDFTFAFSVAQRHRIQQMWTDAQWDTFESQEHETRWLEYLKRKDVYEDRNETLLAGETVRLNGFITKVDFATTVGAFMDMPHFDSLMRVEAEHAEV